MTDGDSPAAPAEDLSALGLWATLAVGACRFVEALYGPCFASSGRTFGMTDGAGLTMTCEQPDHAEADPPSA